MTMVALQGHRHLDRLPRLAREAIDVGGQADARRGGLDREPVGVAGAGLAVLPASGEAFFSGPARSAPLSLPALSWQVEGCSWLDDQTILLGSEQGDLFRLPVSALQEAK